MQSSLHGSATADDAIYHNVSALATLTGSLLQQTGNIP